jgi:glycosyltransferase involved in cell wall biosynthesis
VSYHGAGPLAAFGLARDVLWNREAARRLDTLIEAFRPEVAHLHNVHHQLSPSILETLHRRGTPVVQTLHDYKWVCPAYLFLSHGQVCERCGPGNRFHPVLLRRCHHESLVKSAVVYFESSGSWRRRDYERIALFLAPSHFMGERMTAHGLPEDRVAHGPYFIRTERYVPAPEAGSGFLYVGRLSKEKGIETLVTAVSGGGSALRLSIAGSGPLESRLRERVARERLPVEFLGHLEPAALHEAIRKSRAVVVPSEWYENQPYAVLEALALGVPVIGSSIGGIPELIRHGETGLLVPPGDPAALRSALEMLAKDPAAAHRMGRAGRAFIEQEFAAAPAVRRMLELYATLAGAAL